ncbi:MAG: cysteine peptidase family C39 domain-containing protein [Candidatus Woesearchaeota archaeon]
MKMLRFPKLRQTYDHDCGAKALQAVLAYYGIEVREDVLIKHTETTKDGTSIDEIVNALGEYGLDSESRTMTIEEVIGFINSKIPVMLVLQAWTKKDQVDWENDWDDGHYAIAIGYSKKKMYFEDPSSFHRTFLAFNELKERWHDVGTNGNKYINYGIAIYGKKPGFKLDMPVHMD